MYCFLGIISATADMTDLEPKVGGGWTRLVRNIRGNLQENGDFIFYVDYKGVRKLVQTTNTGEKVMEGFLFLPANNWESCKEWKREPALTYKVVNFHGVRGIN